MTFWIESDPLVENFLQNHRAFDVLHLEPPYEHVNKVDEGELDQSAEHLNSRLYIVFLFFYFIFFISISSRSWDGNSPRQSREWWRCPLPLHIRPATKGLEISGVQMYCNVFMYFQPGVLSSPQVQRWPRPEYKIHQVLTCIFLLYFCIDVFLGGRNCQ